MCRVVVGIHCKLEWDRRRVLDLSAALCGSGMAPVGWFFVGFWFGLFPQNMETVKTVKICLPISNFYLALG